MSPSLKSKIINIINSYIYLEAGEARFCRNNGNLKLAELCEEDIADARKVLAELESLDTKQDL